MGSGFVLDYSTFFPHRKLPVPKKSRNPHYLTPGLYQPQTVPWSLEDKLSNFAKVGLFIGCTSKNFCRNSLQLLQKLWGYCYTGYTLKICEASPSSVWPGEGWIYPDTRKPVCEFAKRLKASAEGVQGNSWEVVAWRISPEAKAWCLQVLNEFVISSFLEIWTRVCVRRDDEQVVVVEGSES